MTARAMISDRGFGRKPTLDAVPAAIETTNHAGLH
jgi:hypothetical protein